MRLYTRRMDFVPNRTPWVDTLATTLWEQLAGAVPADMLPLLEEPAPGSKSRKQRKQVKEYGCGVFGCVMPVARPRTVLKVTSDESEAQFVAVLPTLRDTGSLQGIVEYYMIRLVPDASRRGRPIFLIWREEARDIGMALPSAMAGYFDVASPDGARAKTFLVNFFYAARNVRSYVRWPKPGWEKRCVRVQQLQDWAEDRAYALRGYGPVKLDAFKGPHKAAVARAMCLQYADGLSRTDVLQSVGHALESLIWQDVLLADVHFNNVGTVDRPDYRRPLNVVTDPGLMVLLDPDIRPEPILSL